MRVSVYMENDQRHISISKWITPSLLHSSRIHGSGVLHPEVFQTISKSFIRCNCSQDDNKFTEVFDRAYLVCSLQQQRIVNLSKEEGTHDDNVVPVARYDQRNTAGTELTR